MLERELESDPRLTDIDRCLAWRDACDADGRHIAWPEMAPYKEALWSVKGPVASSGQGILIPRA